MFFGLEQYEVRWWGMPSCKELKTLQLGKWIHESSISVFWKLRSFWVKIDNFRLWKFSLLVPFPKEFLLYIVIWNLWSMLNHLAKVPSIGIDFLDSYSANCVAYRPLCQQYSRVSNNRVHTLNVSRPIFPPMWPLIETTRLLVFVVWTPVFKAVHLGAKWLIFIQWVLSAGFKWIWICQKSRRKIRDRGVRSKLA